jgi:NADP-dependent 3-hydroxy acid dehydrogenase YdfG
VQHSNNGDRTGAVPKELPSGLTEPDIAEHVRKSCESAVPADSFARAVALGMSQPDDVDVNELLFRPTRQGFSSPFRAVGAKG